MNKLQTSLSNALGIEHKEIEVLPPAETLPAEQKEPTVDTEDRKEDYSLARSTYRDLIQKGNEAIDGINDLARMSESPRAYEVMATLMKTVGDMTKDLYDLQKKTKDLLTTEGSKKLDETNITVDKAVFVGTTAELLKKVKSNQ